MILKDEFLQISNLKKVYILQKRSTRILTFIAKLCFKQTEFKIRPIPKIKHGVKDVIVCN